MDEPIAEAELRRVIVATLRGGVLRLTRHALEEMDDDDLVEQDVRNVLRGGRWDGCDFECGSWRYRVATSRIVVVVAVRSASSLVVVTAWRRKR